MRTVIAHSHIFKNAGTTLDWSLQRSFGDQFLDHRDDELMKQDREEAVCGILEAQPELVALSSHHMPFPLPEIADTEIIPIYILRHPLERITSVYEFERRQNTQSPGALAAKKYDFKEYVAWRMQMGVSRTIRNNQTLFVSGKFHAGNRNPLSFNILQQALRRLKELPLVGVVDRYDEFMVVIEHHLGSRLPELDLSYRRQNVSDVERPSSTAARVSHVLEKLEELQQQVIDENAMDLALYQMAGQRLDQLTSDVPDFEEKLAAFRARCATVQEPIE